MLDDADSLPADAREDMAYLARSGNRIRILDVLAAGPHAPRELGERTDTPRSTLRRILTEMVEREWVERTGDGEYAATRTGEHVAAESTRFARAIEALRTLDEAVGWLPEDPSVDLHHFHDATVRRTDPNSPVGEGTYLLELVRDASEFSNLTYIAPPLALLQAMRDGVVEGRLRARHVLTDDLVAYLRDQPEQLPYLREYLDAGAEMYRYDGQIPCNVFVVDGTVLVANNDPEVGHPCEFIETSDGTVRSWARDLIETYRAGAERLAPGAFTDG